MSVAASKYAGLPDIDTAPDVYETPDPVGDFAYEHDSDSDNELPLPGTGPSVASNENIVADRLDAGAARQRFKDSHLNGDADFASTLAPRKRRQRPLYPASILPDTTTYEMLPRGYSTDTASPTASTSETPLQRLRRLRYEMEEVEAQLDAAQKDQPAVAREVNGAKGKGEVPTGALLASLRYLRNDLTRLNGVAEVLEGDSSAERAGTSELLQRIASPTPSALPPLPSPSPAAQSSSTANAAELDDRLVRLERFVGASEADVDESHPVLPSLVTSLTRLEQQLQLLTQPRHLDTVARRVKTLVGDLERIHEARRKLGDTRPLNVALSSGITVVTPGATTSATVIGSPDPGEAGGGEADLPPDALQRIEALSAILPRLEPLLPLAPQLLARLRTLAPLHATAADAQLTLSSLQTEVAGLREAKSGLAEAVEGLEKSVEGNERTVKGNLEAVEARMAKLSERMAKLGGV